MTSLTDKIKATLIDIETAVDMTGRTKDEILTASKTLKSNDLIDIVAYFLVPPPNAGAKYIPARPVIDDGLTPEQRVKIQEVRKLSDLLNAQKAKVDTESTASGLQSALPGIQVVAPSLKDLESTSIELPSFPSSSP